MSNPIEVDNTIVTRESVMPRNGGAFDSRETRVRSVRKDLRRSRRAFSQRERSFLVRDLPSRSEKGPLVRGTCVRNVRQDV